MLVELKGFEIVRIQLVAILTSIRMQLGMLSSNFFVQLLDVQQYQHLNAVLFHLVFLKKMESAQYKKVKMGAVQIRLQVPSAMAGDGLNPDFPDGAVAGPQYAAAKTLVWWDIENC
ncbi:hypothetical protein RDI58_006284 [Solanum bulbocastanum]|uniref:Uncharacterized protein n=1 Tax=Solanum bulbocastanum TaxID=147425 RepID=A0AAN8YNE9_SOLBU